MSCRKIRRKVTVGCDGGRDSVYTEKQRGIRLSTTKKVVCHTIIKKPINLSVPMPQYPSYFLIVVVVMCFGVRARAGLLFSFPLQQKAHLQRFAISSDQLQDSFFWLTPFAMDSACSSAFQVNEGKSGHLWGASKFPPGCRRAAGVVTGVPPAWAHPRVARGLH